MVRTADAHHWIRKRVVILGGGTAGALIAFELQTHANVALVDGRGYFRAMVVPGPRASKEAIQNSSAMLSNVRHIQGKLSGLDEKHVWVKRDTACPLHHQIVRYDILVFAQDVGVADERSDASGWRPRALAACPRFMALAEGATPEVDDNSQVVAFPRWFAVGGLTEAATNGAPASLRNDIDKVARSIKAFLRSRLRKDRSLTARLSGGGPATLRDDG